jgi:phospholipid N-methyltransferase
MKATDWNAYYSKPYKTATVTRKITGGRLVGLLSSIQKKQGTPIDLIELGGANSCFYDSIQDQVKPKSFSILDNNSLGLKKFQERISHHRGNLIDANVLEFQGKPEYDVVFSVGLIEHFSPEDTYKSVMNHWSLVKPNGYMILFFPTPTWLYRVTRKFAEWLGLWIFHDERPLQPKEIIDRLPANAVVEDQFIIWPIFLTQAALAVRKTS